MAKFWHPRLTPELIQNWEQKLKESGFEDAEEYGKSKRFLKEYSRDVFLRSDPGSLQKTQLIVESRLTYFQTLETFVANETQFEDENDRLIMQRTAEGRTIREISEELKSQLPQGRERSKHNRDTIRYVRRRYEKRWGIREWTPEQMVSRKPRTK